MNKLNLVCPNYYFINFFMIFFGIGQQEIGLGRL